MEWQEGSLAEQTFVVSSTEPHFQVCGRLMASSGTSHDSGPGEMQVLFRADSGELRLAQYSRMSDIWALEDFPTEMATLSGPAACAYDQDHLEMWIWSDTANIHRFTRPFANWTQGWDGRETYEVEGRVPGSDFHAVSSGGHTTLV